MLEARNRSMPRLALVLEFLVLFIGLPLAYRFSPVRFPVLPVLWAVAAYAWWQLLRDPHFDRTLLWNAGALSVSWKPILLTFAIAAFALWLGVHVLVPELEWSFLRRSPGFWTLVMALYPVLSVYPQALVYRAFFFQRYAGLFPGRWPLILASAAVFAFMHVIFRNGIAVVFTFAGGILFAARYAATGSLFTAGFEHALYGCWIFTVGLGQYFYHGTISTVGSLMRR